jgi:hypothetical protein
VARLRQAAARLAESTHHLADDREEQHDGEKQRREPDEQAKESHASQFERGLHPPFGNPPENGLRGLRPRSNAQILNGRRLGRAARYCSDALLGLGRRRLVGSARPGGATLCFPSGQLPCHESHREDNENPARGVQIHEEPPDQAQCGHQPNDRHVPRNQLPHRVNRPISDKLFGSARRLLNVQDKTYPPTMLPLASTSPPRRCVAAGVGLSPTIRRFNGRRSAS